MMNIIEVKELTKVYSGRKAVDGISFEIKKGEAFGLLGPNGAGKTTTISMLSCLITPTSGDALIEKKSIIREPIEVKKRIGVVPQDIALYPTLSAKENLFFWGEMYGLSGRRLKEKVDEVLQVVGLTERSKDRINKYSGGMKRRINIAVGLLPSPKLLILDEPTTFLDVSHQLEILELITDLNGTDDITVLMVLHDINHAARFSDEIIILQEGFLYAHGDPWEMLTPKSLSEVFRINADISIDRETKKPRFYAKSIIRN